MRYGLPLFLLALASSAACWGEEPPAKPSGLTRSLVVAKQGYFPVAIRLQDGRIAAVLVEGRFVGNALLLPLRHHRTIVPPPHELPHMPRHGNASEETLQFLERSLLQLPDVHRALNWRAVSHLFTFLTTPPAESIVEGICKLPPGNLLTVSAQGDIQTERYWACDFNPDYSHGG